MKTISRPEPNSTPDGATELLLQKARLVFGEQDWSAWEWSAREYGTSELRVEVPYLTTMLSSPVGFGQQGAAGFES